MPIRPLPSRPTAIVRSLILLAVSLGSPLRGAHAEEPPRRIRRVTPALDLALPGGGPPGEELEFEYALAAKLAVKALTPRSAVYEYYDPE